MRPIEKFWFLSLPLDLELKQYQILAFFQTVQSDFEDSKLYPSLGVVIDQIKLLEKLNKAKQDLFDKTKKPVGVDKENFCLIYESEIMNADASMNLVYDLIDFSLPKFKKAFKKGSKIYTQIESDMKWGIVGIVPDYMNEGYFILHIGADDIQCFKYKIKDIVLESENYSGINCKKVGGYKSTSKDYENFKKEFVSFDPELPTPLIFSIKVPDLPLEETILPIVKRSIMARIKNKTWKF